MNNRDEHHQQPRRRGRTAKQESLTPQQDTFLAHEDVVSVEGSDTRSAFSIMLKALLGTDQQQRARLAEQLQVVEITLLRWMEGTSQPRALHLQQLLNALPLHREELMQAIQESFPGVLRNSISTVREIQKDLYWRVLELHATIEEVEARRWQITQAVFDYALQNLDSDQQGIAITYAGLMPPCEDGIHSLYEVMSYGSSPWPDKSETHIYLGNTTLAGRAAMARHLLTWDVLETFGRIQVEVDQYEKSACACPVTRGSQLSGVLIVSSTQANFFANPVVCQSIVEYALLLGLAFHDEEFFPFSMLRLRAFPAIAWQRKEIAHAFVKRVLAKVGDSGIAYQEAEAIVRAEMEKEFEDSAFSQEKM